MSAFAVLSSGDEYVADHVIGPFPDAAAVDAWLDGVTDFAPDGRAALFIEGARDLSANGGAGYPDPTVYVVSAATATSPEQWDADRRDEWLEASA